MDRRSLISESVVAIQIGVHPVGEEPDQHVVHVTSGVSCTTTGCEVPTKLKSVPCSQDEVSALAIPDPTIILGCLILPRTNHLEAGGSVGQNSY
jgi:hypothetical protein